MPMPAPQSRRGPVPDAWILAPVANELGEDWAGVGGQGALVALGLQGWLRRVDRGGWVTSGGALPPAFHGRSDVVALSAEDVPPTASIAGLQGLSRPDGTLLLTMGGRGGLAIFGDRRVTWPTLRGGPIVDPTGAGDVFLAAYVAGRLLVGAEDRPRLALWLAAAAAACSIEATGLRGVPGLATIAARLRASVASRT